MHPLWIVLALLILAIPLALRPRSLFRIAITTDGLAVRSGHPPAAFLAAARAICRELDVRGGEIRGVAAGRQIRLWFSWRIPSRCRQRLRNAIGVHQR